MSQIKSKPTVETNPHSHVRMVVAYEDFDAGQRAHRACQQILELANLDKQLNMDMWKFEMFKLPAMREVAVEEAAGGELLVLAPQDGSELPSQVLDWLQSSLVHPRCPKALLVLLGPEADRGWDPPLLVQLKALVKQYHLRCWCLKLETPMGAWTKPVYASTALEKIAQKMFSPS